MILKIDPSLNCRDKEGKDINIENELDRFTSGFLWGFQTVNGGNDRSIPKRALISLETLYLKIELGGTGLINYKKKLQAFRIMLIHKYCNPPDKPWKSIVKYWFCYFLRNITNEEWNSNNYPHCSVESEIPLYFKQCIEDFKDYHSKFGYNVNENLTTKIIYERLLYENQHVPAAIRRFSELAFYFPNLKNSMFLDPYLREFLYKLYHCKLIFKRFRLNINDLLNLDGQKCILCNQAIETPKHLFTQCRYGNLLRSKRNEILSKYSNDIGHITDDEFVYGILRNGSNSAKITQYLITLSNYVIYKYKLKKFFNRTADINEHIITNDYIGKLKLRIMSDHNRLLYTDFIDLWDPGESNVNTAHDINGINNWLFIRSN